MDNLIRIQDQKPKVWPDCIGSELESMKLCLAGVAHLLRSLSYKLKCHRLNSQAWHVPRFWVQFLARCV